MAAAAEVAVLTGLAAAAAQRVLLLPVERAVGVGGVGLAGAARAERAEWLVVPARACGHAEGGCGEDGELSGARESGGAGDPGSEVGGVGECGAYSAFGSDGAI